MIRFSLQDDSSTTYSSPLKIELPRPRNERSVFDMFSDMGIKIHGGTVPVWIFETFRMLNEAQREEFINDLVEFIMSDDI